MTPPDAPLVSVIIPSYDRPAALRACLNGFCRIVAPFVWELIVVDDGSPTDLAGLLHGQFTALPLRWIRQKNAGPAAARNAGAKVANGRFLLFSDDDCIPHPYWLREVTEALVAYPTSLVGGQTLNALNENVYSEASQLLVNYLYDYFAGKDGRFFTSNNFGMARQLFWQIGGFDESMPLAAGEDRDLCDRWLAAGLALRYVPAARIAHYHTLTLRTFWQQHVNYGRGARQYHARRANRERRCIKVEPFSFYWGVLAGGWRGRPLRQALQIVPLLVLSQLANATGFLSEPHPLSSFSSRNL